MAGNYFADTTAIFEYYVGETRQRARVQALFESRDVVTSEHVLREWMRVIYQSAADFLEAAESQHDLAAVFKKVSAGYGRQQAQRLLVAALISRGSGNFDVNEIQIRARQLLRGDALRLLRRLATDVRTNSACGLAEQRPQPTASGRWEMRTTCVKREGICRHEARLEADIARWGAGASALEAADREPFRKMGKVAAEMADKPAARTGKNCYARTGDLAIALDCQQDEILVTTDHSFLVLGPALGFQVHHLPATTKGAG